MSNLLFYMYIYICMSVETRGNNKNRWLHCVCVSSYIHRDRFTKKFKDRNKLCKLHFSMSLSRKTGIDNLVIKKLNKYLSSFFKKPAEGGATTSEKTFMVRSPALIFCSVCFCFVLPTDQCWSVLTHFWTPFPKKNWNR